MRKVIFESVAGGLPKPPSYDAAIDQAYPLSPPAPPKDAPPSFPVAEHQAQQSYPPPPGPPPSHNAGATQNPPASSGNSQYPPPPGPPPGAHGQPQPPSGPPLALPSPGAQPPSSSKQKPRLPAWGSRTFSLHDYLIPKISTNHLLDSGNPYAAALATRSDSGEYPEAPYGAKPSN